MPSRDFGDFLLTNWAESVLFFPEVREPSFPFQGTHHMNIQTFFIVAFPFGIVWVCLPFDFNVPFDRDAYCLSEIVFFLLCFSIEDPIVSADGFEVFLRDPFIGFPWMPSFHPLS
jgi:hypothetical protein